MSDKIEHWTRRLDEAGTITDFAFEIEQTWKEIERLQYYAAMLENKAMESAKSDWTMEQINTAMQGYSVASAQWIAARQIPQEPARAARD